jgi:D-alanyl-lipoteichoic acid acyltransferase DltB (MBOAT superfamily)
MNTASTTFFLFGLIVAVTYNLAKPVVWRKAVVVVANIAFLLSFSRVFSTWIPYLLFLLLGYTGYLLARTHRKLVYIPMLFAVLTLYFWLKKYTFFPEGMFLRSPYVSLGLSYVLFRVLHLLIDTHEGEIDEFIGPVTFFNYTMNFTSIVSGPIQLYKDYAASQSTAQRPRLDLFDIGVAMERIVLGYFKVNLLGYFFKSFHERALTSLGGISGAPLLQRAVTFAMVAVYYPLFLYCNFSGYMDIVIGVAGLFRLKLPENFERPFESKSFLDFWGRWHISLSSWLKTYVYGPLLKALMGRFSNPSLVPYLGTLSFFVTFFLIGLWHGRTSIFAVYGIMLGLGVSVNKLYNIGMGNLIGRKSYKALRARYWYEVVARGCTFTYFCISLFFFWSQWKQLSQMARSLGTLAIGAGLLILFAASTVILAAYEAVRSAMLSVHVGQTQLLSSRYTRVVISTTLLAATSVFMMVLGGPAPEIVYKAF